MKSQPSVEQPIQSLELDIRGQICPSTLLVALKEVNARRHALKSGELRLTLKTDNRDATVTIPEAMENMGYQVNVAKQAGHYALTIWADRRSTANNDRPG